MKLERVFVLALFLLGAFFSQNDLSAKDEKMVIRFSKPDRALISHFNKSGYDIASVRPGEYLDLVVSQSKSDELKKDGYEFKVTQTYQQLSDNMVTRSENKLAGYRSYEDLIVELEQIQLDYPDICKVYDIGDSRGKEYSENGVSYYDDYNHDIWVVKISDNVEVEEDEPSFYYLSEHHSREPISLEVNMNFLYHILENYGTDPDITASVDNKQIWFLPLVNPNGHKIVTEEIDLMWRKSITDNNDNQTFDTDGYSGSGDDGVDPNRNYGFQWGFVGASGNINQSTYHGTSGFSEPGTSAVKELVEAHHFVAGISYHSYSELVLFPYGYEDGAYAPDHNALEALAIQMGESIPKLDGSGTYTPQNAWQLYPCMGTTDDFTYGEHGVFGYTVELGTEFIPPSNQIQTICDDNLEAALILLNRTDQSTVTGIITSSETRENIVAEVYVSGIDDTGEFREPYKSDENFGRYYRLLTPGSYDLTFSAYGYVAQTIEDVVVTNSGITELNIVLVPNTETITVTGTITDGDTETAIEGAMIEFSDFDIESVSSDALGNFTITDLYQYNYDIMVYADNYAAVVEEISVSNSSNQFDFELYEMPSGEFEDGSLSNAWQFNGNSNWTIDNSTGAQSSSSSAKSGSITDDQSTEMKVSANISEDGEITFYKKVSSEGSYDYLQFFIDGLLMDQWAGDIDWSQETYDVEAGFHTFSWNYFKDGAVSSGSDCAWIDNIVFPTVGISDIESNYQLSIINYQLKQNYPNPFNPSTKINFTSTSLSDHQIAEIVVYNAMGQQVWSSPITDHLLSVTGSVVFNGSKFNSGIYYYSLVVDGKKMDTKAMVLIK